jgi:CheY-like chemotaxis protein/HPt (histidine-containing phosphotransfer) domain-containing protein
MSHEIRTPMNAILGFADMVVHKNQDKTARIECAQIIHRNAVHLLDLINEILDLSKIEALQMKVERIACDLPELFSEIISLMRSRALEKGLEFAATFVGPIPRVIQTDPLRLRQILVNLLGNAVKFTKSGKIDLCVSVKKTDGGQDKLSFDVIDTGIGMDPAELTRIFQPFTQGDESITRKFGGTGLGLTISRRLAELLDGSITVTSEIDVGSKFTLTIDAGPTEGAELLQHLTEATLPVQKPGKPDHTTVLRGRILLVEDGPDNQRLLRLQLRDAGAEVVTADDGQMAVDLATAQPFDLILMDMQMPIMDGYTATAELRRRGLKIPIIAFTASAMADDRGKCLESGCDDYLSKPTSEEALLKSINQHLGGSSAVAPGARADGGIAASKPKPGTTDGSNTIYSSQAENRRISTIIPEFVEGLSGAVQNMIDLLERNDLDALKKIVHQLRGTSGGYGFEPITDPATKAEDSIKAGKAPEEIAVEINSLIEVIRRIDGYHESKRLVAAGEPTK